MTSDTFVKTAAPAALAAALIGIPADLYHFTIDSRVEAADEALFKAHGLALVIAMSLAVWALAGIALRLGDRLGTAGRAGTVMAFAGTQLVLANIAVEGFGMPLAPEPLSDPEGYYLAVIIASFAIFAAGWALIGIAAARTRAVSRPVAILLVVGAVIAFTPVQGAYILLLTGIAAVARSLAGDRVVARTARPRPSPAAASSSER